MKFMKQALRTTGEAVAKHAHAADRRTAEAKAAKEQKVVIVRYTRIRCNFCELEPITY